MNRTEGAISPEGAILEGAISPEGAILEKIPFYDFGCAQGTSHTAGINENKNSMKTKIQFHFFIHIHSNNKLFILNIFINFYLLRNF